MYIIRLQNGKTCTVYKVSVEHDQMEWLKTPGRKFNIIFHQTCSVVVFSYASPYSHEYDKILNVEPKTEKANLMLNANLSICGSDLKHVIMRRYQLAEKYH